MIKQPFEKPEVDIEDFHRERRKPIIDSAILGYNIVPSRLSANISSFDWR